MTKFDIVVMFIVAQGLALWSLWGTPSIDVNGQALLLAFLTMEVLAISGWLAATYIVAPTLRWLFKGRRGE